MKRPPKKPKPGYLHRLFLAREKHPELHMPGTMSDVAVQHDDWCRIYKGHECNCIPDITITRGQGKFAVDAKGNCTKLGFEAESIPVLFDPRQS